MATEKTTKPVEQPKVPMFSKEQFLSSTNYTVGQKAFIGVIEDKAFPMTVDALNKRLGVK